ncbi:autotransporter outer membrane beta-barrel domain-containing protein [Bradyrhizobium cajani]|uniref:Autotransporter domain-containing protein n=1 Tax=Bradyrhizobium cajani TaxID=1928661 RepID=A0A844TE36_9BRAD|nr:autotransporter domain-containing protein [Bradyrhizobium cajani]MCP3372036.1 autotransporter domain-containing protein [Bradyrhizobium cajani]MVT76596.1 autotransporter domain-containing protein [Bradyrhizobium cajani]
MTAALPVAAVGLLTAISNQAAAQTWNGGPGFWAAAGSWTPATVPNAVDAVATFNATIPNQGPQVNLQAGTFTIGTLNLNSSATNSNFGFVNGTLIMGTSAGSAAINVQSSNPFLSGDITAGGVLQLNSNTVITTASASAEFLVDSTGQITGPGSLTVAGPGRVTLNSANTYAGGTTVTGGTLTGGHATAGSIDAFGAGAMTMSGGTLRTTVTGTLANDITFTAGTTSTLSAAAGTTLLAAGGMNVANAHLQFGSAADTGTVQLQIAVGTAVGTGTTLAVNGGTLQAIDGIMSFFTGNAGSTTVAAGAVLDYNDHTSALRNLLGAGTVNTGSSAATIIAITNGDFGGVIQGAGRLSLSLGLSGTVTLTGANTYTGGTIINSGHTLQLGNGGTTGSIVGNVANNGTFAINRSNVLALTGVISGTGALEQNGTGITALSAVNTYTGATTVNNGILAVNGSIASSILTTVNANGSLTGGGAVGAAQINAGAVFSPGAPGTPGTSMTLASLAMQSGATYFVYANPTTSTFANVTGNASLGGATVAADFAAGSYVAKQYTILSAGSIGGTFDPTVLNFGLPSGFTTTLSYDATHTHAYLNLVLNFAPPSGNLNGNQQNVGNAIINFFNSNGTIPIAFGGLTPAGLTQLSGEVGSAPQQATFNAMNQFMGVMTDPFIAGRGDPVSAGGAPNAYADETAFTDQAALAYARKRKPNDALAAIYTKAPVAPSFEQRWSVWAAGFGGAQQTDGNAVVGSNTTTSNLYGTAVGADYRISRDTLVGFALAGGGTNFTVANALGGGRSDLFQAGAFFRHIIGPAYIAGALAYGWQDITTDRTVTAAGVDRLRAEFNANTYSGRLEGGYRFVTQGVGLTPYAAAQFTTFDLPAYAEQAIVGSNQFALAYGARSVTDTRTELGLRTDKSFAQADGIVTLRGRLAWAHDFNPDRAIGATFQTLPGASFVVNGAAMASDSALVTGSVEKKWLNGWSAAGTFEGEFSNVTRSYAGKGVVRYAW